MLPLFLKRRTWRRYADIRRRQNSVQHSCSGGELSERACHHLKELSETGMTVIEDFITPDQVSKIRNRYHLYSDNFIASSEKLSWYAMDKEIYDVCSDPEFLQILRSYYGDQPYLQEKPSVYVSKPSIDDASFVHTQHHYPARWHIDYRNEVTAHLVLSEITEETPHTLYALGSHKDAFCPVLVNDNMSEADVTSKYEVVKACAKPGSLLIMDTTGLHRAYLGKGFFRTHVHIKITPGNDLLFNVEKLDKVKKQAKHALKHSKIHPEPDNPTQALKGLLPNNPSSELQSLFKI